MFDFTFVLPGAGVEPVGGFKIVYEYANRLSLLGYKVSVVHSPNIEFSLKPSSIKRGLGYIKRSIDKSYIPRWFELHSEVDVRWVPKLQAKYLGNSKVFVATAWQTARSVAEAAGKDAKGLYLIQDYETWSGSVQEVKATYAFELTNIAISRWLQEIVISTGNDCHYIPNALESKDFYITQSLEDRNPCNIGVLFHPRESKNFATSLEALKIVKQRHPMLRAKVFGATRPEYAFPEWVDFHFRPAKAELRELYNSCAIFLTASKTEGWGLTGCEALQCGCALVASNIPGHREYAIEGETALLFPALSPQTAASRIEELISDKILRTELSTKGNQLVNTFTWDRAINSFLKLT
ncbi:glycosyltransferase family 1 protein (plasmid) [Deinococcus wulumuqiensis]|uniref:Glycosyltransferase family 1 protein n=1 Tax=Deinococcus wulumuqiensis TaxID=980427 RepID=A0A345IKV4_9DEIO|nr:glycosyltransferase family 4 protein [Deinococcus wulumuqiensis]AXH00327.1 glycosyltransferase family 1 protein [Deinococcus wulumuqiensis]